MKKFTLQNHSSKETLRGEIRYPTTQKKEYKTGIYGIEAEKYKN